MAPNNSCVNDDQKRHVSPSASENCKYDRKRQKRKHHKENIEDYRSKRSCPDPNMESKSEKMGVPSLKIVFQRKGNEYAIVKERRSSTPKEISPPVLLSKNDSDNHKSIQNYPKMTKDFGHSGSHKSNIKVKTEESIPNTKILAENQRKSFPDSLRQNHTNMPEVRQANHKLLAHSLNGGTSHANNSRRSSGNGVDSKGLAMNQKRNQLDTSLEKCAVVPEIYQAKVKRLAHSSNVSTLCTSNSKRIPERDTMNYKGLAKILKRPYPETLSKNGTIVHEVSKVNQELLAKKLKGPHMDVQLEKDVTVKEVNKANFKLLPQSSKVNVSQRNSTGSSDKFVAKRKSLAKLRNKTASATQPRTGLGILESYHAFRKIQNENSGGDALHTSNIEPNSKDNVLNSKWSSTDTKSSKSSVSDPLPEKETIAHELSRANHKLLSQSYNGSTSHTRNSKVCSEGVTEKSNELAKKQPKVTSEQLPKKDTNKPKMNEVAQAKQLQPLASSPLPACDATNLTSEKCVLNSNVVIKNQVNKPMIKNSQFKFLTQLCENVEPQTSCKQNNAGKYFDEFKKKAANKNEIDMRLEKRKYSAQADGFGAVNTDDRKAMSEASVTRCNELTDQQEKTLSEPLPGSAEAQSIQVSIDPRIRTYTIGTNGVGALLNLFLPQWAIEAGIKIDFRAIQDTLELFVYELFRQKALYLKPIPERFRTWNKTHPNWNALWSCIVRAPPGKSIPTPWYASDGLPQLLGRKEKDQPLQLEGLSLRDKMRMYESQIRREIKEECMDLDRQQVVMDTFESLAFKAPNGQRGPTYSCTLPIPKYSCSLPTPEYSCSLPTHLVEKFSH